MSDSPSVAAVVINNPINPNGGAPNFELPFLAYIVSNPGIAARGKTEEEAFHRLKELILDKMQVRHGHKAKFVDLKFDEFIIDEVHKS